VKREKSKCQDRVGYDSQLVRGGLQCVTHSSVSNLMGFRVCYDSQNSRVLHFSRCKSRGNGHRVSYGMTLKLPSGDAYMGSTYIKLGITCQSLGTNGKLGFKILKFSAYWGIATFTWG
jgi:hypothetical protein